MMKPPFEVPSEVIRRGKNLKIALFDVDGVLTDGALYYGPTGEELKRFNVLDGHGMKMLQSLGIEVGVISAKHSDALTKRLNDLGIKYQLTGISDKLNAFEELLSTLNIQAENACFTGDDVIDIEVMQKCGLAFSVDNAHYSVKNIADWVTPLSGGQGAVRLICDVILYSKQID